MLAGGRIAGRRHLSILLLRHLRSLSSAAGPVPLPVRAEHTMFSDSPGVFATRPITAGELIHTDKPYITHPSPFLSHKVCYNCLRWLGKGDVAADSSWYFCSQECKEQSKGFYQVERKADWSVYDHHCRTRGLKYPLMVKRLACMLISGAVARDILNFHRPASLPQEKVLQMEEEFKLLKQTLTNASIEKKRMAHLTKFWYFYALAQIRKNAFRVELVAGSYDDLLASASAAVEAEAAVGDAVYSLLSLYNHDCDPNTHIIWVDSAEARVKALRDIEAGEELRICYIDASMDVEARQTLLTQRFGFRCQCLRCISGD